MAGKMSTIFPAYHVRPTFRMCIRSFVRIFLEKGDKI